ncbi:MAG: Trk system potassium transporter TrkA [Bacteroidaceae bacterium]|nr:Trk system potassium transporter TrkA [Bacteroidaceae bacterium]
MRIIIAGAHDIGTYLSGLFTRYDHDITVIDPEADRLNKLSEEFDLLTYCGSPTSINDLMAIEVNVCDLFIAVSLSEEKNLYACSLAKNLGAKQCVAKVNSSENNNERNRETFKSLGIDSIIYPEHLGAREIAAGLKLSWVRQRVDFCDNQLVMLGIKLRENAQILNVPLCELSDAATPFHIVAIKRGNETLVPGGSDMLKLLDLVYFMTTPQYISYIRKIVGKENYADIKNVMVMGAGDTALRALEEIPDYMNITVLEKNGKRGDKVASIVDRKNFLLLKEDGRDMSALKRDGIMGMQAFVACTGNAETNILACLAAKKLGVRKTVCVIENPDYAEMAVGLDIGTIVNKKAIAASTIYQMLLNKSEVSNLSYLTTADAYVAEFVVHAESKAAKKKVFELGLPKNCTIGGLVRNGQGQLVSGGTQLLPDDKVVVFWKNSDESKIERYFYKN